MAEIAPFLAGVVVGFLAALAIAYLAIREIMR